MLYPVEVLHRVQGPKPWVGPGAQSLLPVLTRTKTTRGVPQLTPVAFKACGFSLQEPEGFKCFLHEPQGANGEGRVRGEEGSSTSPCISSDPPHLALLGPELCLAVPRSRTRGRRRKQGGCTGHREPSTAPIPSLQAEAGPYLAAARRSLRQAGWLGELRSAGNMNLPPATNSVENKLSPCRAEQLGLGMWARSRPGLRRGERGRIGGVPAPQSPFELPSAGGMKQDLRLPKRAVHSSLSLPPPPSPLP